MAVIFAVTLAGMVRAEVIELHSGKKVEGRVVNESKDSILVDVGIDEPVTYFRDEIKAILPDPPPANSSINSKEARVQADQLEARAVGLIDDGNMNQGLDLIKQAVLLSPTPQRHMNYGSILFGNGVELFKKGQREPGRKVLRDAEEELKKAIDGFNANADSIFIGHGYFLLGEMYANAFEDPAQAKAYYTKSVTLSGHEGAKAALAKLDQNP